MDLYDSNAHFMMFRDIQISIEEIQFPAIYQVNFFKDSDKQTISYCLKNIRILSFPVFYHIRTEYIDLF